jgi:chromosome partitioning protein
VVILDADPQQSAYQWRLVREEDPALSAVVASAVGLEKFVQALRQTHNHVIRGGAEGCARA